MKLSVFADRLGLPSTSGKLRIVFASLIDSAGTGIFLPFSLIYFLHHTTIGLSTIGTMISLAAVLGLVMPLIAGHLIDVFGSRQLIVVGNLVCAIGYVGYVLVVSPAELFLAALLTATGTSIFWTALSPFTNTVAGPDERMRWFGFQRMLRNAGLGIGGVLAAAALYLLGNAGLTWIVLFNAGSYILSAVLIGTVQLPKRQSSLHQPRLLGIASLLVPFRNRRFLFIVLSNVIFVFAMLSMGSIFTVYIADSLHYWTGLAGLLLGINTILIVIFQTRIVRFAENRPRYRQLGNAGLIWAASFAAILSARALPEAAAVGLLVLTMGIFTLGEMISSPVMNMLVTELSNGDREGSYFGAFQMSWSIGNAGAPALFTWLFIHNANIPWILLGCACLLTGMVFYVVPNPVPKETEVAST